MKRTELSSLLLSAVLLLASCSSNKSAPATSTQNNQPTPAPTESAQAPPQAAPAQPAEAAPAPAAAPAPTPEPKPAPAPAKAAAPKVAPAPAPIAAAPAPKPEPPKPVVIPSGTVLTVRLQQEIGSKKSQEGDRFEASLAQPVVVEGKTLIPAGAMASGVVTEAKSAGKFKGGASLNVSLNSITIHGTPYRIATQAVAQETKGKGKRSATMIGGGAGAGALIGGLAGGGKGAAIGAAVGGGAGTAGAAMTGNRDITLAAESALSFKMTEPLTLKQGGAPVAAAEQ